MSLSRSLADPFLYDVRPESEVGVVRVGERTFTVEPKLPIPRLGFVLSYALDLVRWHKAVPYASAGTLADLVAALFAYATS
jgi:hypothetical protein